MKTRCTMRITCLALAALALALGTMANDRPLAADEAKGKLMISHDVYFTLKDRTPEAKAKLVAACKKYLTGHDGVTFYAAGTMAEGFDRPVNDRDFDVALHIIFESKPAHDKYQVSERHVGFVNENKDTWAKVRVFDADVETSK